MHMRSFSLSFVLPLRELTSKKKSSLNVFLNSKPLISIMLEKKIISFYWYLCSCVKVQVFELENVHLISIDQILKKNEAQVKYSWYILSCIYVFTISVAANCVTIPIAKFGGCYDAIPWNLFYIMKSKKLTVFNWYD